MINESISTDLSTVLNKTAEQIKGAYIANILAALIVLKFNDRLGKKIIYDPQNKKLKKYSLLMSPINFWGLVLFNHKEKNVSKMLTPDVDKDLTKMNQRFLSHVILGFHEKISNGNPIDPFEMAEYIRILTLRLPMRTERINHIRIGLFNWDSLDANEKDSVISKTFYLLMERDPNSPLLPRIRTISNSNLLRASDKNLLKDIVKIVEEDGGDGGETMPANPEGSLAMIPGTTSSSIASAPFRLFNGKIVRRKIKKWKPKNKFAKPVKNQ